MDKPSAVSEPERSQTSIRESISGDGIINKEPYLIAVTPANDFFSERDCSELGIRKQITGPSGYSQAGGFKDRIQRAVERAEKELGKDRLMG